MDITLDITKRFNTLVNHDCFFDGPLMNPVLFLNYPNDIRGNYNLELMNFGLNISKEMEEEFIKYTPYFDDIVKCEYAYKSLVIFGKAKFNFTGIKGAEVQFSDVGEVADSRTLYYTWPYEVTKGDYQFLCGGHSPFSPHYLLLYLIADSNTRATITFSSNDYMLMDSHSIELEELASSKQAPFSFKESATGKHFLNNCTAIPGKMFDFDFRNKYFEAVFKEDFHTTVAINSEK